MAISYGSCVRIVAIEAIAILTEIGTLKTSNKVKTNNQTRPASTAIEDTPLFL
jgi:hypothetical protein